jgi:hypothetical protein
MSAIVLAFLRRAPGAPRVALLGGALLALGASACGVDQSGVPCASAAECDDGNPCTTDVCLKSGCASSALADGPSAQPQTSGDCHRVVCKAGAIALEDDPTDTVDDDDECTDDSCINGVPAHLPAKDGTVCHLPGAAGVCTVGVCQFPVCGIQFPCNDGNPCTADGCDAAANACIAVPLDGIPTPGLSQMAGDCVEERCVNGQSTKVVDDADLPDDGNPCTMEACASGKPKHPFQPAGTPCGEALICDGAGHCGS